MPQKMSAASSNRFKSTSGFAAVGGNCKTEPHPGLHADLRIAGIISVHETVPKHQPEVTGMVKSEGDKSETQQA